MPRTKILPENEKKKRRDITISDINWNFAVKKSKKLNISASKYISDFIQKDMENDVEYLKQKLLELSKG